MRTFRLFLLVFIATTMNTWAQQPTKPTASEIYHNLQKLNFLGSALYVAAHPDDENTWLISYLENDVMARTAYLSLTRGDGGQNEIGTDIREFLGVIRTQELLAARSVDGGTQFFTRANDFGYSKHPDETLAIWNEEDVTADIVRTIRKWKPDVIINRFDHRTPGTTHGHHTSSGILSEAAFDLVGDASKYPESAKMYGAWQPKRLFFNTYWSFYRKKPALTKAQLANIVAVEIGTYNANLGLSNGEIASLSRSKHKSQGFGSTGVRGERTEHLEFIKGDFPKKKNDIFEGINTTWSRLDDGADIGHILTAVETNFDFKNPSASIPQLLKAYQLIKNLKDSHWRTIKTKEIEQLITDCAGLYLEAVSDQQSVAPSGALKITLEAINRSAANIKLQGISSPVLSFPTSKQPIVLAQNKRQRIESNEGSFKATTYSAPYWLEKEGTLGMYRVDDAKNIGLPERNNLYPVTFDLLIEGIAISITRNITYKFNDPVRGEVYQPFEVLPAVTTSIQEKVLIFSSEQSREVSVVVRAEKENSNGNVTLQHDKSWTVTPSSIAFSIAEKGATQIAKFTVSPPKQQSESYLYPIANVDDKSFDKELVTLDYEHIPFQSVLIPSKSKAVRVAIEKRGSEIGYIKGAGDLIPESLAHIGYNVTTLNPENISAENLKKFDAVVLGVRAYNFIDVLKFKKEALDTYVKNGGTMVVQYNKSFGLISDEIGPYPFKISRDRVTDETSEVELLAPKHPVLNSPNKITEADFDNWVQERGLYFPNEWDSAYTPILGMNDKGAEQTKGSLLVAPYGKGQYIYTSLSFFRELPAGVPGAYRLFANLLSLGN